MNVVDIIILAVLALSVIVGMYRGFVASLLSMGSCLISLILSFVLSPKLVTWIQGNQDLTRQLLMLTDASSRVGDQTLSLTNVSDLTQGTIQQILSRVQLPYPLDKLLENNLLQKTFAPSGMNTVSDYVSQTIVGACLNVLSFLVCFAAAFFLISVLINLVRAIFRFPALKHLDLLAGGLLGFLRGMIL